MVSKAKKLVAEFPKPHLLVHLFVYFCCISIMIFSRVPANKQKCKPILMKWYGVNNGSSFSHKYSVAIPLFLLQSLPVSKFRLIADWIPSTNGTQLEEL